MYIFLTRPDKYMKTMYKYEYYILLFCYTAGKPEGGFNKLEIYLLCYSGWLF